MSGEYTRWIDAHWGVATFVDAGQAADDRDVFSLALGYGLGARWKSPAGPLAVATVGTEADRRPERAESRADDPFRPHPAREERGLVAGGDVEVAAVASARDDRAGREPAGAARAVSIRPS